MSPVSGHKICKHILPVEKLYELRTDLVTILCETNPTTVPLVNDSTPFFFYSSSLSDKSRDLIHISVSTWTTNDKTQSRLLDNLADLRDLYLSFHDNIHLDSYGRRPSEGSIARYTINIYPRKQGYLEFHKDITSLEHPHQALALLHNPDPTGFVEIDYQYDLARLDAASYDHGDILLFNPSFKHRVYACVKPHHWNWRASLCDKTSIKEMLETSRIDCAYVNTQQEHVRSMISRQCL